MGPTLQDVRAEKCRRRLADFVRYGWGAIEPGTPLDWGWHLDAICDHVQWTMEEWARKRAGPAYEMQVQNLLINIPPRSLKSRIVSVCAPAWAWLHWPEMTFITLSANPRVAADNARDSRDLILSTWYQTWFAPSWTLKDDRDALSDFGIEAPDEHGGVVKLGYRKSRGWFSAITGEGADCILPDDPHDAEEVNSEAARVAVINKWKNAMWNRVRDLRASIRIGIMQRVHEEDWSGYVLKAAKDDPAQPRWCHLRVPLEFSREKACATAMPVGNDNRYRPGGEETWRDPRTEDGAIMDPVRFTPAVVESERVRLGSYGFSGQYNQDPEPAKGGIFQRSWWRFWAEHEGPWPARPTGCASEPSVILPKLDITVISVDASGKKTVSGSETGIQAIGAAGAKRFVLDDKSGHHSVREACELIIELWRRWNAVKVIVEDKALGPAIVESLQEAGVPGVVTVSPTVSKEARAALAQPQIEAGDVYLAEGAPWLDAFVSQFAMFPKGSRNDRVDTLCQALIDLRSDPSLSLFLAAYR